MHQHPPTRPQTGCWRTRPRGKPTTSSSRQEATLFPCSASASPSGKPENKPNCACWELRLKTAKATN
eukprot:11183419-Lingulodinium_polyedra.AAC.1